MLMRHMFRILTMMLIGVLPIAATSQSAPPQHGLMWQNTGLPAGFPLQIKTHAGHDYYLQLRSVESGEPALAGFIEGGRFFKVLVPPGRFGVVIYAGQTWQGEEKLFGAGALTQTIRLDAPLTFGVRGLSRKAGHLIDLTKAAPGKIVDVSLKAQSICQTYGVAPTQPVARHPDSYDEAFFQAQGLVGAKRNQRFDQPFIMPDTTPFWYQRHLLRNLEERRDGQKRDPLKFKIRSRPC